MSFNQIKKILLSSLIIYILASCNVNDPEENSNSSIIDIGNVKQIIRGFGAANILPWRPDMNADEISTAFGTGDDQLGFSLLRLRIPPDSNDFGLNVPTAKLAHSMGVTIIASPWSPPARMKSNNNIVGGRLNDTSYQSYAEHLRSFVDFMANNGVPIYAVSIQNEPDVSVTYESCDWNASEMLKFLKEYAPIIGTRIIVPESYQFRHELSDPLLNDEDASANFQILGGHIYGGGLKEYPLAESKGKEVWMTEHLVLDTDWNSNLATGKEILDCMNAGMSAYIWWYIVRFYGPIYDEGSDPRTPEGSLKGGISKRGYVMSHFARFVRPGFYRIEATANPQPDVFVSAFKNDTKIVIISINEGLTSIEQTFIFKNGNASKFESYVTSQTKSLKREGDITQSSNSFTVKLDGSSISTFIAN